MKKTITLLTLAAFAISMTANAKFTHTNNKSAKYVNRQHPTVVIQRAKSAHKIAPQSSAPNYKPLHEEEYEYYEGVWEKWCDYYYEYDNRGNILVMTSDDGATKNRTTQKFNSDNLFTEKIEETAEDGVNFVNSTKQTRVFDPYVKDLVVELQSYTWMDEQWQKYGNSNKRDITRDANNNVTEVIISTWYMDNYEPVLKQTITYDDRTLASVWRQDALTGPDTWSEELTLSKMEWFKTDGQITSDDYTDFFYGNNCLKSAIVTENEIQVGTIKATYDETGASGNRTIELTYLPVSSDEVLGKDIYTYTYTDNYGSLILTQDYYEDMNGDGVLTTDEIVEAYTTTAVYDSHGNMTLLESTFDGELSEGEKYEYTYDETMGALKETIVYSLNYDTMEYEPMMKIIADNFTDVANASVDDIQTETCAEKEIYSIQGVKVGNSLNDLPTGIYIVKQGSTVKKVTKLQNR